MIAWVVGAVLRTGLLLVAAWVLDRALRDRLDPVVRMALYAPVWLRLVLPRSIVVEPELVALTLVPAVPVSRAEPALQAASLPGADAVFGVVWLVGIAGLLTYGWLQRRRFDALLRGGTLADDAIRRQIGRPLAVWMHPTMGPLVHGILHPVLVLPAAMARDPGSVRTRAAVAHEVAHLDERHLWLSAALHAVNIACWPLVPLWLASRRVHQLMEQAADARAVRALPEGATAYGRALVDIPHTAPLIGAGGLPMAAYENLRERVHILLEPARWPRRLGLPVAVALATLSLGLATEVVASGGAPAANELEPELGRSVVLSLPQAPSSVEVGDPSIVAADWLGPTRLVVRGLELGTTTVTLNFKSGPKTFMTTVTPVSTDTDEILRPTPGAPATLELPSEPTALMITNPAVARVHTGDDPTKVVVEAMGAGVSDLIVELSPGRAPLIYAVVVE